MYLTLAILKIIFTPKSLQTLLAEGAIVWMFRRRGSKWRGSNRRTPHISTRKRGIALKLWVVATTVTHGKSWWCGIYHFRTSRGHVVGKPKPGASSESYTHRSTPGIEAASRGPGPQRPARLCSQCPRSLCTPRFLPTQKGGSQTDREVTGHALHSWRNVLDVF